MNWTWKRIQWISYKQRNYQWVTYYSCTCLRIVSSFYHKGQSNMPFVTFTFWIHCFSSPCYQMAWPQHLAMDGLILFAFAHHLLLLRRRKKSSSTVESYKIKSGHNEWRFIQLYPLLQCNRHHYSSKLNKRDTEKNNEIIQSIQPTLY